MSNTRLTVVVRKDLDLPAGLLAAQVAHMSDAFLRELILKKMEDQSKPEWVEGEDVTAQQLEWCKDPYLSVLAVECYEDLVNIYADVKDAFLPCHKWEDVIPSPTFEGQAIKAFVGLSIGPADFDSIKIVTNGLKLY